MRTRTALAAIALLTATALTAAQAPTTAPASRPADPNQARIDKILADQEAAGDKLTTLSAKMIYEKKDVWGDAVKKTGSVVFRKPQQFRINLEFVTRGKRTMLEGKSWIFDGKQLFLLDRPRKRLTIFNLPPPKPGAKPANPLELGKGPFPMPFGQKADAIRKLFDVKLTPPTDPEKKAGLSHLRLTPKKGTELARRYKWIDLWYDGELKLPLKLRYLDRGGNEVTVTFPKADFKVNDPAVTADDFAEPKVNPRQWTILRAPL